MGKNNKIKKFFKRYYQIMLLVFVMLFSVMAVAGNVLRNEKLIDNTKKDSSSSTVTDTMKDSSIKELDINSSLVRQLYSIAYDNRYGLKDSFIYPDMDKIIIGEMEFSNKMRLVLSNLENNKYTSSDCNTNLGNTYRYNNKTYTCKVSSKGRIDAQTILDKYRDLYGNTDNFDTSVPIVEDGLLNNIYLYGIDKKTNQASYYLYQKKEEVVNQYNYTRKITSAISNKDKILIVENVVAVASNGENSEENIRYTFNKNNDDTYTYYSREKIK